MISTSSRRLLFGLAVVCVVSTARAQDCSRPVANGLSYWPGDGTAHDVIGPNVASLIGGAGFVAGWVGPAFAFDGADDYAAVPFHASYDFQLPSSFSIALWMNASGGGSGDRALVVKSPSSGAWDWGLYLTSENKLMAGGNAHAALISRTVAVPGVWYHVAVTYQDSLWQLYVNGTRESATSGILISRSTGGLALARKGEAAGSGDFFAGSLDEVEIFNRSLTPCAVSALFAMGRAGQCKGDDDGDGVSDLVDNCIRVSNASQADQDADGVGDLCDCAPADGSTYATPAEIDMLAIGTSNKNAMSWCSAAASGGNSSVHQIVRGFLTDLPVGSGGETCIPGSTSPFGSDSFVPTTGDGVWYLVRGKNGCGTGTYGNTREPG